jgi:hypothetical protein
MSQPRLMFMDKARSLPKSRKPERRYTQIGISLSQKYYIWGGKASEGQTLKLIRPIQELRLLKVL